jgi:hypothetical protein
MKSSVIFLSIIFLISCKSTRQEENPELPYVSINTEINLNDMRNQALTRDGGYIYTNGGLKGLIIYREDAGNYYAFERNCPYQPSNACAFVKVDISNLYMKDTCCKSFFDFRGNPTGGPATIGLKKYYTELQGNRLRILN